MHEGRHDHAQDIERAAAGDGGGRAEAIGQPAREGRYDAHQQHRERRAEGKEFAADVKLGGNGLQEDAKTLANAKTDGQDEETAPDGGPIRTGGHGPQLAATRPG